MFPFLSSRLISVFAHEHRTVAGFSLDFSNFHTGPVFLSPDRPTVHVKKRARCPAAINGTSFTLFSLDVSRNGRNTLFGSLFAIRGKQTRIRINMPSFIDASSSSPSRARIPDGRRRRKKGKRNTEWIKKREGGKRRSERAKGKKRGRRNNVEISTTVSRARGRTRLTVTVPRIPVTFSWLFNRRPFSVYATCPPLPALSAHLVVSCRRPTPRVRGASFYRYFSPSFFFSLSSFRSFLFLFFFFLFLLPSIILSHFQQIVRNLSLFRIARGHGSPTWLSFPSGSSCDSELLFVLVSTRRRTERGIKPVFFSS